MKSINSIMGFGASILAVIFLLAYIFLNFLSPATAWNGLQTYIAGFSFSQMFWLFPAFFLAMTLVVLMSSIHYHVTENRKTFSLVALIFIAIYAAIITINYFLQLTVVRPNLLSGETEGLSLFAMTNPNGIFIALESLGYLIQEFAFLFVAFAFTGSKLQQAIRWTFLINFVAGLLSLAGMYLVDSMVLVVATVLVWAVTLTASGILLSVLFNRERLEAIVARRQETISIGES